MDVGCVASDALTQDGFELHFSFLSAPPPPGGLGRPHSFCTRPVAPLGRARAQTELLAHLGLDLHRDLGMLAQEVARVLAALADAVATEGVPGAGLLDDTLLGRDVDQLRSEEHTSELQSLTNLVCRLLLEKKKKKKQKQKNTQHN